MDVRCQKCGIEYEFDDAKVTVAGVTVKCTNCGHVFKVKKETVDPMAAFGAGASMGELPRAATATTLPPVKPQGDGSEWMVRQTGGTVFRFKELTTLQKWIVERKVGREDEISKTGRSWKRLGDISELSSFFQVVDAANAASNASAQPPPAPASNVAQGPAAAGLAPPTGARQSGTLDVLHTHVTGGTQVGIQAISSRSADASVPDARPPGPSVPSIPLNVQMPTHAATATGTSASSGSNISQNLGALDDDDPVVQWKKNRRRRLVLGVFFAALLVSGGVLVAMRPPWLAALVGDPGAGAAPVSATVDAIKADDPRLIDSALTAVRGSPATPAAHALEARLLCARASHAREEERLNGLLGALVPAQASRHAAAAAAASQRATAALSAANQLVLGTRTKPPTLNSANLASAAYNLEKGALAEMRTDLEAARVNTPAPLRGAMDSEIGVMQALADGRGAIDKTDAAQLLAAAERVPSSGEARLNYARAALAVTARVRARETANASIQAPAVAARVREWMNGIAVDDARKRLLLELLQVLDAPAPTAVDAGPTPIVDAGTATGPVTPGTQAVAAADAGPAPDAGTSPPENYDALMRLAERANIAERSVAARDLYQRALKLKPGSVRAWIGLGWAQLSLDKNAEAQRAFRRALAIDDSASEAQFGLAEALKFAGNKQGALDAYRLYLQIDPNGKDAGVARRAIESLQ